MSKIWGRYVNKNGAFAHCVETNDGNFFLVVTNRLENLDPNSNAVGKGVTYVNEWDPENQCISNYFAEFYLEYETYEDAVKYHDDMCRELEDYLWSRGRHCYPDMKMELDD